MVCFSVKINRKKIALLLIAAVVAVTAMVGAKGVMDSDKNAPEAQVVSEQGVKVKKGKAKTNETRLEFIHSFGWEVEEEPVEILEVVIPEALDAAYQEYNKVQQAQGFDLNKYCGKQVKKYTYMVTNYPQMPDCVQLSLFIYKNTVVGADVSCTKQNGFMQGIQMPSGGTTGAAETGAAPMNSTPSGDCACMNPGNGGVCNCK